VLKADVDAERRDFAVFAAIAAEPGERLARCTP
jgi:hypothetical protein